MALRLLLDTHTIIWWALDQQMLSQRAFAALEDSENIVFFSPVTAMEIATKVRIGKLDFARPLITDFTGQLIRHGFTELPLQCIHSETAGGFVSRNNDPWDRLLAAQAKIEGLQLVSKDTRMGEFGINLFW